MTDKLPYEGAIEEAAKATGKALDLIKAASPAIADVYGLAIGDTIKHARSNRLHKMAEKAHKKLSDRGITEKAETPEQIAIPLLEAAQLESREELIDLWARLMANAMDPDRMSDVRASYIDILKKFEPLDAKIIEYLSTKDPASDLIPKHEINSFIGCRQSAAIVSVDNLESLGCIRAVGGNHLLALTELGRELVIAVRP